MAGWYGSQVPGLRCVSSLSIAGITAAMLAESCDRGQRLAVRPIVVAHRGGGGGMWQGMVWVARDGARDESLSSMGHVMGM